MRQLRIRSDLDRAVMNGFAFPLGIEPGAVKAPRTGYTVTYNTAEDEEPDTYSFQAVISHDRIAELCARCFRLLPDEIFAIVEIGSRDAYRTVDVFIGSASTPRDAFEVSWRDFSPFLLEDGTVAAGANSEEPFVEVFLDQRKTLVIHVPLDMRDDVEAIMAEFGLEEVAETWPEDPTVEGAVPKIRPVLDLTEGGLDIDEVLLELRHRWHLQLNLDPDTNLDEAGRNLGVTLWNAEVIVYRTESEERHAFMTLWLTARSLNEAEAMIHQELELYPEWQYEAMYNLDRVAHDERPPELDELPPRPTESRVHLVTFESRGETSPEKTDA
jgi:hypothetical protein